MKITYYPTLHCEYNIARFLTLQWRRDLYLKTRREPLRRLTQKAILTWGPDVAGHGKEEPQVSHVWSYKRKGKEVVTVTTSEASEETEGAKERTGRIGEASEGAREWTGEESEEKGAKVMNGRKWEAKVWGKVAEEEATGEVKVAEKEWVDEAGKERCEQVQTSPMSKLHGDGVAAPLISPRNNLLHLPHEKFLSPNVTEKPQTKIHLILIQSKIPLGGK